MGELTDYSGPFNPNLKAEDFSKGLLIKVLNRWGRQALLFEGLYQSAVREKYGDEAADELAYYVYSVDRMPRYATGIKEILGIKENDVEACIKCIQWDPTFFLDLFDWEVEFENKNHAVVTVKKCPPLLHMEKEGKGYEKIICHSLEVYGFQTYAAAFNPAIKVKPLKLPPRISIDDIACQWDYQLVKD